MMEMLIPWQALRTELRSHRDHVVQNWIELLSSGAGERDCVKFLNEHAGFFFCDSSRSLITIAELELGADFRPDFVVTHDFSSLGFSYEFIEVQDPNEQPLKTNGQFSNGLNEAIAQITKWHKWLTGNRDTAKRILPSRSEAWTQSSFNKLFEDWSRSALTDSQPFFWLFTHSKKIDS
jgi:hypothetical protein